MKKRIAVLLLLFMMVFGRVFAGPLAPGGWGLVLGGAAGAGTMYILDDPQTASYCWIVSGIGCGLLLLDLLFTGGGSSSTAQAQSNTVLEHVSLGVTPNAAYLGVRLEF
jgi:hypothetical protein